MVAEWIGAGSAAVQAIKTGVDWCRNREDLPDEVKEQLSSVLSEVLGLQSALGEARTENEQLREQLAQQQSWADVASKYHLEPMEGGAHVYVSIEPHEHFACPACFAKRERQILQDMRNLSGEYQCPGCKTQYPIHNASDGAGDFIVD